MFINIYFPALKIHCSKECRDILNLLGGYKIEDRGLVSMKVIKIYKMN